MITVITINRNNRNGLQKTVESVASQSYKDYEYVIIDGASTDGSVDIIKRYSETIAINWVSEPDSGIYNAMNKGISKATGEYLLFLNSGDYFFDSSVLEKIASQIEAHHHPDMLVGRLQMQNSDGTLSLREPNNDFSFLLFYCDTIPHQSTFIKKNLFARYGLYDESLRIVSDWKWFMQVIVFHGVKPVVSDVDVVLYDMTGISETAHDITERERRKVLSDIVPHAFLSDYDKYFLDISRMQHLRSHRWAFKIVCYLDKFLK